MYYTKWQKLILYINFVTSKSVILFTRIMIWQIYKINKSCLIYMIINAKCPIKLLSIPKCQITLFKIFLALPNLRCWQGAKRQFDDKDTKEQVLYGHKYPPREHFQKRKCFLLTARRNAVACLSEA